MFAKQTLMSASLVCTLLGLLVPAAAEPEPEERADGEAVPDGSIDASGSSDGGAPAHVVIPGPPGNATILVPPTPPPSVAPPRKRPPTGRFEIGAGYRTDDGFIARAEVAQDNLFGTGNKLSLAGAISARQQLFLLRFVDPDLLGSKLSLTADVYNDRRLLPGMWRHASGGAVTLSAPIEKHLRAFLTYRFESVEVAPEHVPIARGVGARPTDRLRIGSLRGGLVFDSRDNPHAPRRGGQYGVALEVADRELGSDVQILKFDVWGDWHQPIGPLTLHVGGRMSSVHGANLAGVPRSELLYLDGSSELRGYRPGQLAPLGGNAKGVWRSELEVPLISKWGVSAVGFFDAAAIIGDEGLGSGASTGVGLLWRSPLGPIRVDYAIPLDGSKPGFVFNVGSMF